MVARLCKYIRNHLRRVTLSICELYFNKVVIYFLKEQIS